MTVDNQGREVILTEAFAYNGQYEVKAKGYRGTAQAGQTTNLDFPVGDEDRYINGLKMMLVGHAEADKASFSVVDTNGIIPEPGRASFPDYPVLKQFVSDWNFDHTVCDQGSSQFPYTAKIAAGLFLRVAYVSTGIVNVTVKINTLLHKKVL